MFLMPYSASKIYGKCTVDAQLFDACALDGKPNITAGFA
jgi:hypothetical protein